MTDENKEKIEKLKEEIKELDEQLEDSLLLKRYYSGADDIEDDTRNLIKQRERIVKIIKILDE